MTGNKALGSSGFTFSLGLKSLWLSSPAPAAEAKAERGDVACTHAAAVARRQGAARTLAAAARRTGARKTRDCMLERRVRAGWVRGC
jgi:hypothetical protein